MQKGIDAYIEKNPILTKKYFVLITLYKDLNDRNIKDYEVIKLDIKYLVELENILIKFSHDNYFIFDKSVFNEEVIKKISVSNNTILYIDKEKEKEVKNPIIKMLVNKILTPEELLEESF